MAADGAPGSGGVELPPGLEIPTDEVGPVFAAPWQARVFGTVVALHRRHDGDFDWADFQALLIEEVQAAGPTADASDVEEAYYGLWLRAAERLLQRTGILDGAEMEARAAAFAAGERNAQEFIEGEHQDAHGHPHDHDHSHDRGHSHDHGHPPDHDHGHETGHEH